jgi:hypothetical protein
VGFERAKIISEREIDRRMPLIPQDSLLVTQVKLTLPRFCGRGKSSERLYQKESKDHGKSPKDLDAGVEA